MGNRIRTRIKKELCLISGCVLLVFTTACQKTPKTNAVVNKEGQATLVKDNATKDDGTLIRTRLDVPETVQQEIECNNDYTRITIDANVVVPEISAIPVYSVRKADMSEAFVQRWAEGFFEDGKIRRVHGYWEDGYIESEYTQDELYAMIENETMYLESRKDGTGNDDEIDLQIVKDNLEEYARLLLNAPEELPYDKEVDYTFGEFVSEEGFDADDGSLSIWNKTYNCIFLSGEHNEREYEMAAFKDGINGTIRITLGNGEELFDSKIRTGNLQFYADNSSRENSCKVTYEEAVDLCDEFLADMGISNMKAKYSQTAYVTSTYGMTDAFEEEEGKGWLIYYYRDYGRIGDSYMGDIQDTWMNTDFWWGGIGDYEPVYAQMKGEFYLPEGHEIPTLKEKISFLVSDDGIVAMEYQNPMEEVKQLAENVELLSFDKVLDSAYAYLEVMYDDEGTAAKQKSTTIGQIELNLARVQNPNAENEFTMLPVWDFRRKGSNQVLVTVNAIDGSILNRDTGY